MTRGTGAGYRAGRRPAERRRKSRTNDDRKGGFISTGLIPS